MFFFGFAYLFLLLNENKPSMSINENTTRAFELKRIWLALLPTLIFVIILWLVTLVSQLSGINYDFSKLGILPRHLTGLKGVLFSPFIHASFSHLLSNTLPLLILFWCTFYFYREIAYRVIALSWVVCGLMTWIIGRDSYHVGASGLVFAMFSFLFFSGIFRRYTPLIAVSMLVAFIYGSTIWSIFPITEYVDADISWEGHLSGVVGGLITAIVFRNRGPQRPTYEDEENEENDENDGEIRNNIEKS